MRLLSTQKFAEPTIEVECCIVDMDYLNPNLLELNLRVREAFSRSCGLSKEQMGICRWVATGMAYPSVSLSTSQKELVAGLEGAVSYAREHKLGDQVAAWCMAAAEDACLLEDPGPDRTVIEPIISEFLREYLPPSAKVLDVASGTGRFSRPLAAQGYKIALYDPAIPFLEMGLRKALAEGAGEKIRSLICGTFADLAKLEASSYDLCLCVGSMLYVDSRERSEQTLYHLARIASKAVVVEVASKHGLILQLGAEFDVSANAIKQIFTTGVTPAARPESCGIVYSCFSSNEFREVAQNAGLNVQHLVGFGITETPGLGTSEPISAQEALKIEILMQSQEYQEQMIDSFPSLLALCTKYSSY